MNRKDKEGLKSLYDQLNADLFVIEKYTGKPKSASFNITIYMNGESLSPIDMLAAKEYLLSKSKNGTIKLEKNEELPGYLYESEVELINKKGTGCYHEQNCPVSYLKNWRSGRGSV